MSARKLHLVTGTGLYARSYCGRSIFGRNGMVCGTPNPERFREVWLNNPSYVCDHCAAKAKALKII